MRATALLYANVTCRKYFLARPEQFDQERLFSFA